MTRRHAALVPILLLAACAPATPTSSSPFRAAPSSSTPVVPPTTTVPSPDRGPTLLPGTPISGGVRTEVTVEGTDTGCFRDWDASGHCRQFNFVAPADGTMRVTLELPSRSRGLYDPEAFLVTPDRTWDVTFDPWPVRHVSMPVKSGLTYHVVVMSYGPFPDTVFLTVDLS